MTETRPKRDNQGGLFRTKIRALLRQHPEGMTLKHIGQLIPGKGHSLYRAIKRMPDAYCSHWIEPVGQKQQAVFKVVMVPPDAPKPPMSKKSTEERNAYLREYRLRKKEEQVTGVRKPPTPKPPTPKPSGPAPITHEEIAAREAAMIQRYSNPPTYKPLPK